MAVSFRTVGTWAELTADGSVTIPATPQAGDRMFLYARWKDFSITATVANWTPAVTPFADGAITAGNGTGSVKVGCWYRDWQSGDTDPTIDFSAAPENASVVITVMQKGVDDVWATPIAVTAAITNWTTTSQIVSASATAVVRSGGVVIGLIGLRDDSATMTRPATGIDDSTGAITWNGNYVESPATHHSTTTGFDGAADLGYRLVTIGATATLRMTGTISAAETGAALWVVQNTIIAVTPNPASLTVTSFTPTLKTSVTPAPAALAVSTLTPILALSVIPAPASFSLTSLTPILAVGVIPSTANLTISTSSPALFGAVIPAKQELSITTFAPELMTAMIPDPASLVVTTSTPLLVIAVIPATQNLSLVTFAPSLWPRDIVWADPGGDAVQAVGYFNTPLSGSTGVSFDTSQKVVGEGSYKFDSLTGVEGQQGVAAVGVLSHDPGEFSPRRFSCCFRYDSVPDKTETRTVFVGASSIYSGGGFSDLDGDGDISADNELYATAAPAKNAGQGTVFDTLGLTSGGGAIPVGAAIDSLKVIYERKYDVDTSEGISRVKYRIDGIEGPDYDNTDMPLTDTVVTVEFTDRGFTRDELTDARFEIIAEARRGDSDTEHTQSWDYVKVEVVWHLDGIIEAKDSINEAGFKIGLSRNGTGARLRFIDNDGDSYLGITQLAVNTWNRISFGYVQNGANDLSLNLYVNSILELSISDANATATAMFNLRYGWLDNPGADHLCWFDQIYIDDGDDLSDPVFGAEFRPPRCTAKLPATVNENTWNTTVGTGAINERPLSTANHMKETRNLLLRQTYTLETDDEGDIDISGETLLGYMGWAWAKLSSSSFDNVGLVVNDVEIDRTGFAIQNDADVAPVLFRAPITSVVYPSDAAGIGMISNEFIADTLMYECGVVQVYLGPAEESILPYQILAEDSVTNLTDDLRADPPATYDLRWRRDEGTAEVTIEVYSITFEGQEPQLRHIEQIGPGGGLKPIDNPGIEVSLVVRVMEANVSMGIHRLLNLT